MATQRPTSANAVAPQRPPALDGARLTRAEQRALRRSEPLTSMQFKELRRLAEQGISPLRHL